MSAEKLKVLGMLQEGKISTEDALELLKSLGDEERGNGPRVMPPPPMPPMPPMPPEIPKAQRPRQPQNDFQNDFLDLSWIGDLCQDMGNVAKDIAESMGDDIMFPPFAKRTEYYSQQIENVGDIREIRLEGKNDSVEVVGCDGDIFKIEAKYRVRGNNISHVELENQNGCIRLNYDPSTVYSMKITAQVPKRVDRVSLETRNAPISLRELDAQDAELVTKNASVRVEEVNCKSLTCESRNGSIKIEDATIEDIDATTTNSKIELDGVNSGVAKLRTSNDKIATSRTHIRQLTAKTTNSSLHLGGAWDFHNAQYRAGGIDATTTNGSITIDMEGHCPCKINASTSNGSIKLDVPNLQYAIQEKCYVEAKTADYDGADRSIGLSLKTSNGSIKVRQ